MPTVYLIEDTIKNDVTIYVTNNWKIWSIYTI